MNRIKCIDRVTLRASLYLDAAARHEASSKPIMAQHARVILRNLAQLAALDTVGAPISTDYNRGGPAVSGEVYLRAPGLHAWIEVSCALGPVLTFRSRFVRYADGPNHTVSLDTLTYDGVAIETAQRMAHLARIGRMGVAA